MTDVSKAKRGFWISATVSGMLWAGSILGVTLFRSTLTALGIPEGSFTQEEVNSFPLVTQITFYFGIAWFGASMISAAVAILKGCEYFGALDDYNESKGAN